MEISNYFGTKREGTISPDYSESINKRGYLNATNLPLK